MKVNYKIFQQLQSKTWEQTGNDASDFHPIKFHSSVNVRNLVPHIAQKKPAELEATVGWLLQFVIQHSRLTFIMTVPSWTEAGLDQ